VGPEGGRGIRPWFGDDGRVQFSKGHGTGNDFVLLPDPDGQLDLTPSIVAALCDRRRGIGADGVLRVVRAAKHPEAVAYAGAAEWFMDYWNADGSIAEMCGNGTRVFTRYLISTGLAAPVGGTLPIVTRSGVVRAEVGGAEIGVDLGAPRIGGGGVATLARPLGPKPASDPNDPSTWGKVSRNASCPCGSGKKFKHCHGRI